MITREDKINALVSLPRTKSYMPKASTRKVDEVINVSSGVCNIETLYDKFMFWSLNEIKEYFEHYTVPPLS